MRDLLLFGVTALFLAVLPFWAHSRRWGYAPAGGLLVIALVMVVLSLSGRSYG
jgi:hypothetical protein